MRLAVLNSGDAPGHVGSGNSEGSVGTLHPALSPDLGLASGLRAGTYLASLALQVDFGQSQHAAAHPAPDPEQGLRVANKALAEIDNVQQTVIEMQKDLGRLKETVGEQEAKDKEAQSRLSALEERMSTLAAAPARTSAVVVTVPPARPKVADKAKSAAEKKVSEQRPTSRIISVPEETKSDPAAHPDQPKLETGSITAPPPAISFGEPQVTPVRQAYSVQLGAGPVARCPAHELDGAARSTRRCAPCSAAAICAPKGRFWPLSAGCRSALQQGRCRQGLCRHGHAPGHLLRHDCGWPPAVSL